LIRLLVAVAVALGLIAAAVSPAAATSVDPSEPYLVRYFPHVAPNYYKMSSDVNVWQTNLAGYGLFYAESFKFYNDPYVNNSGYFGLQTRLDVPGYTGRGIIFTIWNATGAAGNPAVGAYAVGGVEQGAPFKSIRVPWAWPLNHWYRLEVARGVTNGALNENVSATLYDLTGGGGFWLGYITVPNSWAGIQEGWPQWTEEYYPNSYASCDQIPVTHSDWGLSYMTAIGSNPVGTYQTNAFVVSHTCPNSNSVALLDGSGNYREILGATS
jgi:hypothetical protein